MMKKFNVTTTDKWLFSKVALVFMLFSISCSNEVDEEITQKEPLEPGLFGACVNSPYDWLDCTGAKDWKLQYAIGNGSNDYRAVSMVCKKVGLGLYLDDFDNSFSRFKVSGGNLRFEVRYGDDGGPTGSKARTELREMTRINWDKSGCSRIRNAGWSTAANRTFEVRTKIVRLDQDAKAVTIAQYFSAERANGTGNSDDIVKVRARRSGNDLVIETDHSGLGNWTDMEFERWDNRSSSPSYFTSRFETRQNSSGDHQVRITYVRGSTTETTGWRTITSTYRTDRAYFKCGAYLSSSGGTNGAIARVDFSDIDIDEQNWSNGY